jgi:hypothetical protein
MAYADRVKIYQGGFRDGEQHGTGVLYYRSGGKSYDGEFKDGWRHGSGREFYESGAVEYEGGWSRGERHGWGVRFEEPAEDESGGFEKLRAALVARGLPTEGSKAALLARLEGALAITAEGSAAETHGRVSPPASDLRAWLLSNEPARRGPESRTGWWSHGTEVDQSAVGKAAVQL